MFQRGYITFHQIYKLFDLQIIIPIYFEVGQGLT